MIRSQSAQAELFPRESIPCRRVPSFFYTSHVLDSVIWRDLQSIDGLDHFQHPVDRGMPSHHITDDSSVLIRTTKNYKTSCTTPFQTTCALSAFRWNERLARPQIAGSLPVVDMSS